MSTIEKPLLAQQLTFSLEGKVVAITGGSKGIGRIIAEACAYAGADIVIGSRNQSEGEATARVIRGMGRRGVALALDVANVPSNRKFAEVAWAEMGRVDVLVNSAGVIAINPAIDVSEEEYDRILDINLKGAFFASTAIARKMIESGVRGAIINIGSQSGHIAAPLRATYAASKGGLNQLTRTFAAEWAPHGITVNGVSPTYTKSEMLTKAMENPDFARRVALVPLGRPAEPEEVAAAVLYLAGPNARIVTGHTLLVDGGNTIV
jgi:NAD(P)-dependent dehydrogenase (short-subunit alcohol dehydrogenase family)